MNLTPDPLRLGVILLLISCGVTAQPAQPSAPTPAPAATATVGTTADLREARRLTEAREFSAARQLYEHYLAQYPNDSEAECFYGLSLWLEAKVVHDPAAAAALRKQARQELLKAQKLGSQEPLVPLFLDQLKADGSPPPADTYSVDKQVNVLMTAAEAAYNKGDFAQAANLHEQALALEPGNYYAALYCGDAYFSAKDYAAAGQWFAKAVAINPDIETAHRYWADALAHQQKFDDATAQFIEAVIADPYNYLTRERFRQYARAVGLSLRTDPLLLPITKATLEEGRTQISIPPDQGGYENGLCLAYAAACTKLRNEEFSRLFPNETKKRRSLPEEAAGLRTMIKLATIRAAAEPRVSKSDHDTPDEIADSIARWRPSIETLTNIERDGLLEAYVLLERADQEIAQDYPAYRAAHREKVRRFIRVYWCRLD